MAGNLEVRAKLIAETLATAGQIAPLSSQVGPPSLAEAYAIADRVRNIQGRQRVGRKVGFTNRSIWPVYGVDQPIWGTVHAEGLTTPDQPVDLAGYSEPRIEPEIVLGLRFAPKPGMNRDQLANCVDWIAPGFEIVQSIYPDWKFSVEDSIAAQALHGCLVLGEKIPATNEVLNGLVAVRLQLLRGAETVETGKGENALGGPLNVLAHLVSLLSSDNALEAGELISTGTLTDAWTVSPGERWSARYGGVMDTVLSVQFA